MEEQTWLITTIEDLLTSSTKLEDRAFYQGLKALANEQITRLDQSSGELDGRIWNPSRWG
ncbi:hypothetical protein KAR50_03580 [Periweissella fabaria]|uniref:Uncharacterized protein n=1 Tax=Periweissella fabaria TaxID=546157 RepID=A0ABN8BG14_9LACO|nr:hypothetical protein [Periweissella fabaria]MCM0596923.1 hypothetical protein [Periweissella fabaria]CAH0416661.1 hypothetical protein WFA24289_00969 [Periweissella fabaria]